MKRLIILAACCALIFSCAATKVREPTEPQTVIIKLKAVDPVKVEAKKEGDGISRSMEVDNPECQLSRLSFITDGKAFIKLFSGLSISDVIEIWNDFVYLKYNTEIRDVSLFINSPGGDAFSGLALADEIERAKRKGFKITAHASGIIASAAVPVFAVCDKRMASPGTIFMVHEAALWKWPGKETASDIRSQNEMMEMLKTRYLKHLVDYSKLSMADWEAKEVKTTWFTAEQALEWGLVDSIE
jgi:ATP-dependent protease ClpP protease subunit